MKSDSLVNVTEAQARLSKLVGQDAFAISRRGKVVGVFLSRERVEALVESMELLSQPEFHAAVKELHSGRMRTYTVAELDAAMSR